MAIDILKMYSWDSEALGDVYSGSICVVASTLDGARKKAWRKFEGHIRSTDQKTREQFKADLAKEPATDDVQLITSY